MDPDAAAIHREAVAEEWLERTLETYPSVTARFLATEKDPFRNPVGRALREGLPALLDAALGRIEFERALPALDEIIRVRAVQDFTADQAVGFVYLLKEILRRREPRSLTPAVEEQIERMAVAGFDRLNQCRQKMDEIKAGEARRSTYVLDRIGYRRPGGET